jgi:peptide/nickel transport system permease protein
MMPGDPVETMIASAGGQLDQRSVEALKAQFGVGTGQGLWAQYWHYWGQLLQGNLGLSISKYPSTVAQTIGSALWWTVILVGTATVISFVLGTLIGALVGWRRGSVLDNILPVTTFFQAIPYFFLATVLLYVFAEKSHIFPNADFKSYDTNNYVIGWNPGFIGSAVSHAILPALTIVLASVAGWILGMRNMMVTTMDEDYVLVAQAKGLPKRRVIYYAARNAVLPSISSFANALSFVVAGSLLTELVFSYQGIGSLLLSAVQSEDYPLIQGIFLIITFAVLAANLLADTVYVLLDPRTRQEA